MRPYLNRSSLPAATLLLVGSLGGLPARAQSDFERNFLVDSQDPDTQLTCGLIVQSNLVSTATARGFSLQPGGRHLLTVSAVQGLPVTPEQFDAALDNASVLLQAIQNPPADVFCCIALRRTGAIGVFQPPASMVGGVVTTQAEQSAVFSVDADVKLVAGIQFCGQMGNYAGCAIGGTIMAEQGTPGATYAHEIGHREGLCHRATNCVPTCGQAGGCTGCEDPGSRNIMYFAICSSNDTISADECSAFVEDATP